MRNNNPFGKTILFLFGAFVLFIGIGGTCFYQGVRSHVINECKDLCGALNQKHIEATAYGCVCESTDGERHVHTGIVGYEGN